MQLYGWRVFENVALQSFELALKILYQLFLNGCGSKDSTERLPQKNHILSFQSEKAAVHSSSIHKAISLINKKYCANASNVFPQLLLPVTFSEIMRKMGKHWWRGVLDKKKIFLIHQKWNKHKPFFIKMILNSWLLALNSKIRSYAEIQN